MPSLRRTKVAKKFSIYVLIIAVLWRAFNQSSLADHKIPTDTFFKHLIYEEGLGYVLLGEKPALLTGYIPQLSWKHPIHSLLCMRSYWGSRNQLAKKGWTACENTLSKEWNRFLIIKEQSPFNPLTTWIFVIHRNLFCQTVDQNRADFENVLKREITGSLLLKQAEKEPLFSSLLRKHEGLLGMILGYGRHNAYLYYQGEKKQLGYFPKPEDKNHPIKLPFFRADWNDPETEGLRQKYLNAREDILRTYPSTAALQAQSN